MTVGWPSGAGVVEAHQMDDGRGDDRARTARLAALVRDHRRAAGLTQGQLAGLSGVSLAAIRDLEQGRTRRPRPESLTRLADALGLDAAQSGELAELARGGRVAADTSGAIGGTSGAVADANGLSGAVGPAKTGGLRLQVLGPLAAWRDGARLALGGPRQQAVLGLLALAPGSLVHRSTIIDVLWPGDPPPTAVSAVQSHISRLRGLLDHLPRGSGPMDEQRPPGDGGGLLVSAGASYGLRAGPGELDLLAFGQLAEDARGARQAGDDAGACELYERALGLWRGEPLAGVDLLAGHLGLATLARQRTETVIEFAQVASAAGWHERVLAPLRALAAAEPLNERAHAQLMIALAGCGQQAEALGLFGDLRARLDAELAMPPGPDLAEAHLRVLRQDIPPSPTARADGKAAAANRSPAAADGRDVDTEERARPEATVTGTVTAAAGMEAQVVPARLRPGGAAAIPPPRQLPAALPHFTGRAAELAVLTSLHDQADAAGGTVVISAIGGTAGVGKTALALHWAHQVADRFPDGQLYVNLRGFGPSGAPATPGEAIRGFLDALGAPAERIPATLDSQAALYRSLLAGKKMLIVADNARDEDQVRPLLPASPGTLVLVTSRRRLAGLAAAEGAHTITLDVLTEADAASLLARRLGTARVAAEPGPASELIGLCARLPLALAVTAARAATHPGFPLVALTAELRDEQGRLTALDAGDTATSVRAAFSWSYRHLAPAAARMFRLLGLHPGLDVSLPAAASLAGLPLQEARAALGELTAANLLADAHRLTSPAPEMYRLHDLLRVYAADRARAQESDQDRQDAVGKLLTWYVHTTEAAARVISPHHTRVPLDPPPPQVSPLEFRSLDASLDWCEHERAGLVAATRLAAQSGLHEAAWKLAAAAMSFYYRRSHWADWEATHQVGLASARQAGDRLGEAWMLNNLGMVYGQQRMPESVTCFEQALALYREFGDARGEARAATNVANAYFGLRRFGEALAMAESALVVQRRAGKRIGEGITLGIVGGACRELGRFDEAVERHQEALAVFREIGSRDGEGDMLGDLGQTYLASGRVEEAIECLRQAIAINRAVHDRYGQAVSLRRLAEARRRSGDTGQAVELLTEALRLYEELGDDVPATEIRAELTSLMEAGN